VSLNTETGRDRYFAARERELAALIDPGTGRLAERYARRVGCPGCGGEDQRVVFEHRGFTFVRCSSCRLVFSNPQVDEALVLEEYRGGVSNDLWVDVLTSERQLALDREKFGGILDELEPLRGSGRLLDVGCSIGLFVKLALDRGWDAEGIEFSDKAIAYARATFGIDVVNAPLHDPRFRAASYDVVTLNSVLEHTTEPRRMLADCSRVLRDGGALYVIVPNVESLACRVLHERAATFDGRNHLVYFSPTTLRDNLERAGFAVRRLGTRVTSLRPVLEWLAFEEPYGDVDLEHDRLARAAQEPETADALHRLIEELDLGYKLHCLATKQ
jgi:SAM-dependent methyltransferase